MAEEDTTDEQSKLSYRLFLAMGGRLAHIHNGKRVITIAYMIGPANSETERVITYGASVFKAELVTFQPTKKDRPPRAARAEKTELKIKMPKPPRMEIWNRNVRRENNQQAVDRWVSAPVTVVDPVTPWVERKSNLKSGEVDYLRRSYLRACVPELGVQHKSH